MMNRNTSALMFHRTLTLSSTKIDSYLMKSLRTAFIRQLAKSGTVHLNYINTEDHTADTLSKNLGTEAFKKHQIGLLGPQPETLHKN